MRPPLSAGNSPSSGRGIRFPRGFKSAKSDMARGIRSGPGTLDRTPLDRSGKLVEGSAAGGRATDQEEALFGDAEGKTRFPLPFPESSPSIEFSTLIAPSPLDVSR